jgi:uncharacterized protein
MNVKRVIAFTGLAYLFSWIIWLPLYAPGLHLPVLPFHHALGGLGPLLAAFIVNVYTGNENRRLLTRMFSPLPVTYILIALFAPFVIGYLVNMVMPLFSGEPFRWVNYFSNAEFPEFNPVQLFVYNLLFFGFGEETGWRGLLLPELQKKHSALSAALVISLIWAVWHWPLFLYRPGYVGMDAGGIAGWFFSLVTGSILLTWIFNSAYGSVLACAIFHSTIDIVFTATDAKDMAGWIGALITIWGVVTIFIFRPLHLSRSSRTT